METSTEIKDIVLRYYEAASQGKITLVEDLLSHEEGTVVIGTDPNEWWDGYENITSHYKTQLKEMDQLTIVPGDPQAYCEGNVGWATDRPKFKLSDGTQVPTRLTMVFHRENGKWRIIHHHISIGVPNEEVIGKALTA